MAVPMDEDDEVDASNATAESCSPGDAPEPEGLATPAVDFGRFVNLTTPVVDFGRFVNLTTPVVGFGRFVNLTTPVVDFGRFVNLTTPVVDFGRFVNLTTPVVDFDKLLGSVTRFTEAYRRHWLPANLIAVDDLSIADVILLAEEGISLYAVPRPAIVRRVILASTPAARRDLLGRALPQIMDDCEEVLDRCVSPRTREAVSFTRMAIAAARDGHIAAAQALAANTLDTTLRSAFPRERVLYTSHNHPDSRQRLSELGARRRLVVIPIWRAYAQYRRDRGDPIPRQFNRHASAHGVSGRQFSRRNAAQGLMVLTSLIALENGL